jgi:hypothetical protein
VTPSDGALAGASAAAERTVANRAPGPAIARIQPAVVRPGEPIRCEIVLRSEDADGDAVRYRFVWQRNGASQPLAETSHEVPARFVSGGDRWRCVVTPTDGFQDGPAAGTEEALVPAETQGDVRPVSERPTKRPLR